MKIFLIILAILAVAVVAFFFTKNAENIAPLPDIVEDILDGENESTKRVDFSSFNQLYRFSAELPSQWEVEFIPQTEAINIYDPLDIAENNFEKSQIFIRNFVANTFLTLSTVDIIVQESTQALGRDAVRYEIIKKPGIANFSSQPMWRSEQHKLLDIRFTENNPSIFYVFAYRPEIGKEAFDAFIQSLQFHNDQDSFQSPIEKASERITKKPFGLLVSPEDSPVQPERFSGYHTGTDFEIFQGEEDKDIPVSAICGGPLRMKRFSDGFGGVAVQECLLEDAPLTVVYGHLRLNSIEAGTSEYLAPGDFVGLLGTSGPETDGQRKHLHLSIHKGKTITVRGYVNNESDLDSWIDPSFLVN